MWKLNHPVFHLDIAQCRWRTEYEEFFGWRIAESDDVTRHGDGFAPAAEYVDGSAV
jgi:hypothetical protein